MQFIKVVRVRVGKAWKNVTRCESPRVQEHPQKKKLKGGKGEICEVGPEESSPEEEKSKSKPREKGGGGEGEEGKN